VGRERAAVGNSGGEGMLRAPQMRLKMLKSAGNDVEHGRQVDMVDAHRARAIFVEGRFQFRSGGRVQLELEQSPYRPGQRMRAPVVENSGW